ncbi:hypothetical protein FNF29_07657 [Cafeteria roenbergensis]|uniref:C2 domain-containing protein n=1 Tax=Cafeteria roenbergensis TaxID=33653 RepID=A0A5A8C4K5_CAFRO|nr:hypothetical protein FNF29_07657 [Cafeteria roenbergensis]|eukprot:KAA0147030.1 hypothetical protein FNF29_07657 [Cafeteria roenbergensis]
MGCAPSQPARATSVEPLSPRWTPLESSREIPPGNATLQALVARPGRGSACADCGAPSPSWAVLDEGQAGLVCGECAGVHRTGVSSATRNIFWDTVPVEAAARVAAAVASGQSRAYASCGRTEHCGTGGASRQQLALRLAEKYAVRGILFVTVEGAESLPNADSGVMGDVSDPKVLLWLGPLSGETAPSAGRLPRANGVDVHETSPRSNTLNPVWGAGEGGGGPFSLKWDGVEALHVLAVDVDVVTEPDLLGRAVVRLDGIPDYAPLSKEEEAAAPSQLVTVPLLRTGAPGDSKPGLVRLSLRYHGLGEAW